MLCLPLSPCLWQQISLGDLTLLCTLRAAMTTLQHLHDSYLLSTLLAILLDLGPFLQQVSPYCCERIVVLTVRLCRRYTKLMEGITDTASGGGGGVGSGGESRLQDMGECLKVLLALIATSVRYTV